MADLSIASSFDELDTSGNLIIQTFNICKKMDGETEAFIKGASEDEKEVQARWKAANMARREKQMQISDMHMHAAYVSATLLLANVICSVAGVACNIRGGLPNIGASKQYWESSATVLQGLGKALSENGQAVSGSYHEAQKNLVEALIGSDSEKAQELWEMTKREKEARKEDMKQIQQKAKQATEDVIQKTGQVYSVGR